MNIKERCKCPSCSKKYVVIMPLYNFKRWKCLDMSIQDAWPEGSATDRESLISGLCPSCQAEIFKEF